LEKALEHKSRALELTPDGHPSLSRRHSNLGVSYTDRFKRLGERKDLDKALEHNSRALELTPDGHPDLSRQHSNLGVSYTDRFKRLGKLKDLEKALEHNSRALELTPNGHPSLSRRHSNLGVSYTDQFQRLGELKDLEKALEHDSCALELTPDGHPDLSRRHSSLGVSYTNRFKYLGKLKDLEKALEHDSCALELTPDGHPHLSRRHSNLGVSYRDRFQRLGEPKDLEKAIEHSSHALALTPDGHPDMPFHYYHHAHSFFLKYQHSGNLSHMNQALDSFRGASKLSSGAPRKVFQNALSWAKLAAKHSSLSCIEAYRVTMDLLPQFIWLGASTAQRYQDLSTTQNLAVQSASAAILHSELRLALEWLEHARCVVWGQGITLRSPLDQLHSSHPDLASRLQSVSEQLNTASSECPTSQSLSSGSVDPEYAGRHRRSLAKEYNDLLTQVRGLPDFEDFLQPMKANALICAARHGPISIVARSSSCLTKATSPIYPSPSSRRRRLEMLAPK
ncbi:hypothetical protein FRC11_002655, partial [Ceratobasidium sp. 423]